MLGVITIVFTVCALTQGAALDNGTELNFPYQVGLNYHDEVAQDMVRMCTGVLIATDLVLTSNRCLLTDKTNGTQVYAVCGDANSAKISNSDRQARIIEKTRSHPDYKDSGLQQPPQNDIGMLKIRYGVMPNNYVAPIKMAKNNYEPTGKGIVSGFGRADPWYDHVPKNVFYTELEVISLEECKKSWPTVDTKEFCAVGNIDALVQHKNVGAPMVQTIDNVKTLVGYISHMEASKPIVFTKISAYTPYLEETMAEIVIFVRDPNIQYLDF